MNRSFILLLFLLGTMMHYCTAQSAMNKQLETTFDQLLSEQFKAGETGCAALVAQKGQVIYKKAFGMANLELDVKMQPDMIFRIGSITKQFTAVAILQLMEQGKLSLQDDITKFIPDYPTQGHTITIEHLLTHTSGIQSYTGMEKFGDIMRKDMKPEELIAFFKNEPMEFAPGTKWNYNNSGFFLLGYIIEKITGKTYPQYLEENFFQPLGMTHSYYGDDSKIIKNRASGYQPGPNGVENASPLSMTLPYSAGSIQSTVGDLFKWHQAVHAYKLVKKENLEKAFTEYKLSDGNGTKYGYGWFLGDIKGSATIEHGGGINGFLTNAIYLPKEDVFVAVFSNSNAKSPDMISVKMAAAALGKPYNTKEIALEESMLETYVGVYESDAKEERVITKEGKQLYSQRSGGNKLPIRPWAKDQFFFDNSLANLEFKRDANGKIIKAIVNERGATSEWNKTDKAIVVKKEIKVADALLMTYVGKYQLTPNFSLDITQEGSRLFVQATGQGKDEVFAESDQVFFSKVVDAKLEFVKDDAGQVTKLILHQGGRDMDATKVTK